MAARFNPAPGWPPAPDGWVPPKGWTRPAEWPTSPAGWQFWVDEVTGEPTGDPTLSRAWYMRKRILIPSGIVGSFLLLTGTVGAVAGEAQQVAAPAPIVSEVAVEDMEASVAAVAAEEAAAAAEASEEAKATEEAAAALAAERAAAQAAAAEAAAAEAAAAEAVAAEAAAAQAAADAAAAPWTVTNIVDGDTIDVERNGSTERVRVLGLDTPERGQCGYEDATRHMALTAGGKSVALAIEGRDERDRYGRLLAFVDVVDGPDAGLSVIEAGLGIARYDSRDGYGAHPREASYIAADDASPDAAVCAAPPAPAPAAPAPAAPAPAAPEPAPVAPAPAPAPAGVHYANCDAVRAAGAAPIHPGDPGWQSKFDRDKDGVGCDT